ncbi:hypothetical protein D9M69_729180 [compost metagenome]
MKPMPGGSADLGATICPPAASTRESTASMLGMQSRYTRMPLPACALVLAPGFSAPPVAGSS